MKRQLARPTYSLIQLLPGILFLASFRIPMLVTELKVFPNRREYSTYYVCPRCGITLEREFMSFCDRCGQRLGWHGYQDAKIVYPCSHSKLPQ